jgi:hypothetical protein
MCSSIPKRSCSIKKLKRDSDLTSLRVVRELGQIIESRGCPRMIVSDTGTEFEFANALFACEPRPCRFSSSSNVSSARRGRLGQRPNLRQQPCDQQTNEAAQEHFCDAMQALFHPAKFRVMF